MLDTLENDGFGLSDENITPIPSYDLRGYGFSEERYWRGPVWININWFLMHGLEAYGYKEHAQRLRRTIVDLCQRGFPRVLRPHQWRWARIDPLLLVGGAALERARG
jgi:hypothetical protein